MDVVAKTSGGVSAIVEYDYTAKESDELNLVKGAIIHSIKQMPGGWWEGTLQTNGKTGMFPDNFVRVIEPNEDMAVVLRDKSATTNRRCKVIYSYQQVNDDELSLAVGDVIEFLGEVEEGWWRGRLKNKIGVFPSNFVISIEQSPILASKRPTAAPVKAPLLGGGGTLGGTSAGNSNTNNTAAASTILSTTTTTTTKKTNRLSFHNSKEDLLSATIPPPAAAAAPPPTATTTVGKTATALATATTIAAAASGTADDVAPILPPKPQREYCRVEFPYAPQNEDELELKVGDIIIIISMELPDKGWWKGELRGKVGVFPDNFVKLLPSENVASTSDPLQQQPIATTKTAKISNAGSVGAGNIPQIAGVSTSSSHLVASNSANTAAAAAAATTTTSKVFITKSGSNSSTHSNSNRKDSFGSYDSLNDILMETGIQTGNVAAQRKSLENKNFDLSNAPDASTRLGLKKQQLTSSNSATTTTTQMSSSSTTSSTSSTTAVSSAASAATISELRKSIENLDEKTKTTPPPVLTKKPTVPTKKTPTSVASTILSGIKKRVTTATSHDYADGVSGSKMSSGGIPDAAPSGNVVMRRAATIAVEDSDFDRVERTSILQDMRAGRVKAPKRRLPSASGNVAGESNNNSVYLNGSGGSGSGSADNLQSDDSKPQSSDDNSTGEDQLAKPKPREWEKKKAPWMAELKASQEKKKTSPNVAERTSKLLGDDVKISNNTAAATSNNLSSSSSSSTTTTSTTTTGATTTKVQSSSSIMQQSMTAEASKRTDNNGATTSDAMSKSISSRLVTDSATSSTIDDVRARPNSLSIRNRSTSPSLTVGGSGSSSARSALKTSATAAASTAVGTEAASSNNSSTSTVTTTAAKTMTTTHINNNSNSNHHQRHAQQSHHAATENNIPAGGKSSTAATTTDAIRVVELEKRVEKLETVVHSQQRTIDELVRTLREETDRVKVLRGELDKYAQCVTQV